ncbi:similar to Saccharomyces cerevisiae YKL063C Putative protein of unknown function [Maudiozyma saulgeensis]|uniref:Uncharacterized protein n=1 Tax=Maudiozyma saulgeensis TaxID=1789683 RepID=A0A1X7QX45_9SACH|nr:similar to Saccharomyces cerevisiae YKL063C Putative protein of unknown function [Kazachstania saulgeensis]
MQGGIRRKKDLLPRYKKSGNYDNRQINSKYSRSFKIIIGYLSLLILAYLILNVAFKDFNKSTNFELDTQPNDSGTVPKDKQFHNEVAKQQEVENLKEDTNLI